MPLPPPLVRRLGAVLTACVGLVNLLSALFPAVPGRMHLLRGELPIHLIRGSQTATVLTGFFLIVLADGLRKRRRRAMQIAVGLLFTSVALNLLKGLDFEEASLAFLLGCALIAYREAFDVSSALPAPLHVLQRISTFALLYYGYVLAGFLILRGAVRPAPTLLAATFEPFRLLADSPHFRYLGPQSQWFERSMAVAGSVALLYAFILLLRPLVPRRPATPGERYRVRQILQQYGFDTLSYFSLQHGRSYFFDDAGTAFLSYRLWRSVALVAGDPVGPSDRVPGLIQSFLQFTRENGLDICFVGVNSSLVPLYNDLGLRTVKIGEEAQIDLRAFRVDALKRKVRRAARHIEESGICAEVFRRDALPEWLLTQMDRISEEWVRANGGAERGFSMTLGRLPGTDDGDCEVVVALQGTQVWGFLTLAPAYTGDAWSLDSMRRRSDSPNGLMEYLVIRAAESYQGRRFQILSLNFATLSNSCDDINSRALESTRRFLYENLSSAYQLKSLQQFNGKFQPQWRSRYLAYGDMLKFPKLALAVAQTEDPIRFPSPAALFRR